jgi:sugar phosphate isomerase/epimerase
MIWGMMMSGWMSGLVPEGRDRYEAEMEVLSAHGLKVAQWGLRAVASMEPNARERLGELLRERDLCAVPSFGLDYFGQDRDAVRRSVDETIEALERVTEPLRAPITTTGAGAIHRFMREPSLDEQMGRLAEALTPLAAAAHELGCPLGIENHGDYYASDLAALCRRVPHLGIFFDTGNTYLIGERPVPAAEAAAPHVVGTHFKDHRVAPNKQARPLCFEVRGAVIGGGDVGLRAVYEALVQGAPAPDELVMILEIDPVEGMEQAEALEESLRFVRTL